jgi:hypothetical protein
LSPSYRDHEDALTQVSASSTSGVPSLRRALKCRAGYFWD